MQRRSFLLRAGLLSGGLVLGGGASAAAETAHQQLDVTRAGHAVGHDRPAGLSSTTLTYRVRTNRPWVALTFDDGPSTKYTAKVLDILAARDVVATFNLIGRHAEALPALARRAAEHHEIGNHTYSHPDLSLAGAGQATDQLRHGADAIRTVIGRAPSTFRPPYGYFSGATMMSAAGMDYPVVLWDQIINRSGESAASNAERLGRAVQPGSIILGHDGGSRPCDVVVDCLPELIDRVRARGFTFVTVSTLLAVDGQSAAGGGALPTNPA